MKKVALSPDIKAQIERLLVRASYLRDEVKHATMRGWSDAVSFYRAELGLCLAEARALVNLDFAVKALRPNRNTNLECQFFPDIQDCVLALAEIRNRRREVNRNAPVQVQANPAFRRLQLLCVLVQSKGSIVSQPLQCLPRLRAPWAPVSGQWPLVLPAPLRLRAVPGQAPTITQLDSCFRQRKANSVCSYSRAV